MGRIETVEVDWSDQHTLSKLVHLSRGEANAQRKQSTTVIIEASNYDALKIARNIYYCTMNGVGPGARWVQIGAKVWGYTRDDLPDLVILMRCVRDIPAGQVEFTTT